MKHLSLFSGIGGLDLAAEMAGFKTVGQVEIDDYCNRVLEYHWPDVPRWRDVKDVTAETFEQKTGIKPGALAVLSGGFPCQPVSCAGKRKGDTDERWLWDEMLRVICEIRPRWVVAENVRGLLSAKAISDGRKLFGRVLRDLAQNGYRVGWLCYGAGDVGAPHKRERVFIVAHSEQSRTGDNDQEACNEARGACETGRKGVRQGNRQACTGGAGTTGQDVASIEGRQSQRQRTGNRREGTCGGSKEVGYVTEQGLQSREDVADTEKPKGAMDRPIASEQEQGQFGGRGGEGVLAETKKSGLSQSQGRGRRIAGQPRLECDGIHGRGETANRPTQPGLGDFIDGLPAGLAGHRWPAGWWQTPSVEDAGRTGSEEAWMEYEKDGRTTQCRLRNQIWAHWPAGPGEQHPWEPPRIATGVKGRVNKLKALGNAVVPAQAYPIFRAIRETEEAII